MSDFDIPVLRTREDTNDPRKLNEIIEAVVNIGKKDSGEVQQQVTNIVESSPSTGSSGNSGALTAHEADTTTHGTTGDIVGTSDTQTISNKTILSTTKRITDTDSPYTVLATDEIIFCDTDADVIQVNLPAGVEGTHYKIINCGSFGNNVTVSPNGTEKIFSSTSYILSDGNSIWIHYNATEGWW